MNTERPRLYGTDNSWRPATTSLQRERAAAPFERETFLERHPLLYAALFCIGGAIVIGAGLMAMPS